MPRYTIENAQTGIDLGTYEGETEHDALDAMARDAGCRDYAEAQSIADGSDLRIHEERPKHTPTPWRLNGSGSDILAGSETETEPVCIATVYHSPGRMSNEKRKANAAFIVKACNEYERSIELARMVMEADRRYDDVVGRHAVHLAEEILDDMDIEYWHTIA